MKKSKIRNISIAVALILAIGLLAYFGVLNSLFGGSNPIGGDDVKNPEWTLYWDKINSNVNIQASVNQSVSARATEKNQLRWNTDDGGYATRTVYISHVLCGSNDDNSLSIDDSANTNGKLTLSSSFNAISRQCSDHNYIKANFIAPKGILNCDVSRSGISQVKIEGQTYYSCGKYITDICSNKNLITNNISTFNKTFNGGEKVEIEIRTFGIEEGRNSVASISCDFSDITEQSNKTIIDEETTPLNKTDGQTNPVLEEVKSNYTDYLFYLIPLAVLGVFIFVIIKLRKKR